VRQGYLTMAAMDRKRFRVVNAASTPEEVSAEVLAAYRAACSRPR
jgi:thymidylate kinase